MTAQEVIANIKSCEQELASLGYKDARICLATKTQSKQLLLEVAELSDKPLIYGDNRAQELMDNYFESCKVERHFIGTLQTNKVKYIIDKVSLIHSVDSLKLATEISRQAGLRGLNMSILIEISIAGEQSKGGVPLDELEDFCSSLSHLSNITVKGIMCMLPLDSDPDTCRLLFDKANSIFNMIKAYDYRNFSIDTLSAGMSKDYMYALESGSNLIRLGTKIFGERNIKYQN